jgi:putative DNA-invertase from lambdoid prophage Rac
MRMSFILTLADLHFCKAPNRPLHHSGPILLLVTALQLYNTCDGEKTMAVYGYTRVSTQLQSDDGLSLDAQERQLKGYAMMHNLELDKIFVERAVSGWKPLFDRAEGARLSAVLVKGDTVLCPKLDRMFRSARDALVVSDELKKRGVKLHLLDLGGDVTGNGVSKVFFTIVAAFAEFERDRIAERISDVKSHERSKGRFLGGSRPFGYAVADDGALLPDADEQKLIVSVFRLRDEGKSLRAISNNVSTERLKISHMTVKRILRDALV